MSDAKSAESDADLSDARTNADSNNAINDVAETESYREAETPNTTREPSDRAEALNTTRDVKHSEEPDLIQNKNESDATES